MNATTDNVENVDTNATAPLINSGTRPFYWSVRREVWEHRALWIAPLVAAALILLSFLVNAVQMPGAGEALASVDGTQLHKIATGFYGGVSIVITITMLIVTWFYCLDSLYSERRDRSILFWKSLPVSDITTVTSKLFVASAVSPAISFVIVIATQLVILLFGTAIVLFAGGSPGALWSSVSMLQLSLVFLYGLVAQALWFAPIVAWLIFVSSAVRRSPFLWAVLVPAAACLVERIALGSGHLLGLLSGRGIKPFLLNAFTMSAGATTEEPRMSDEGFHLQFQLPDRLFDSIDPLKFLTSVDVWVGLAIAAALIAATVWMRRYREPL